MATGPLTGEERDRLLERARDMKRKRFPPRGHPLPSDDDFHRYADDYYLAVGEYFDRLPRVVMSACPYCGKPLVRAFDPWGVDGLWWGTDRICTYDEPAPCDHFQVLLGALRVDEGRLRSEMMMTSQPGPEIPFVVPNLLSLPNMIAVVGGLAMARGGAAYPIAYYSDAEIEPIDLHQEWCRDVQWFSEDGEDRWTIATDPWDFDLDPYLESEQLRWALLNPDEETPTVHRTSGGETCPFVGLAGERRPQSISGGKRYFLELPDGHPAYPFDE